MSTRKRTSRSRRKVVLLNNRLDFNVADSQVDPSRSKNVPNSKRMEERISASQNAVDDDEGEDGEDFVHENWEELVENDDNNNDNKNNKDNNANNNNKGFGARPVGGGGKALSSQCATSSSSTSGRTYPQDLWFLLSERIHPETVQAFGRICRGSRAVLKTFGFWAALYRRTYDECRRRKSLPEGEDFAVSLVIRPLGVKFHVIKALFHIHPPLKEMLQRQKLNSVDFDLLKGYRCSSCWLSNPSKTIHVHNLLLERPTSSGCVDKSSLFNDTSEAVMYNPFQDSVVLQIICDQFSPTIWPMGLHLVDVKYNSSRDMINMRLELGMSHSSNFYATSSGIRPDETKVIDPVSSVRVLHWWHPNFPTIIPVKIPESSRIDDAWDD